MLQMMRLFYRKHYLVMALITAVITFSVAFVLIEYAIEYEPGARSDFAIIALQSIITAIIIGLAISIVERLASAEKNRSLVNEIDKKIRGTLNLQLEHGFRLIHDSVNEIEKIDQMDSGVVYWMNTILRDYLQDLKAITGALHRGVRIDLLLMHEDNPSRETRVKYTCQNIRDEKRIASSIEKYKIDLAGQQSKLIIEYKNYKIDKEKSRYKGEWNIRFYKDTPGLPLFIMENIDTISAFSGFYLDSYSSNLPYVVWQPSISGSGLVENLKNYFQKKWYFAEDWDVEKLSEPAVVADLSESSELAIWHPPYAVSGPIALLLETLIPVNNSP